MKEVPGNLIHNLPHLMKTLWGQIAWAQAGHRRGASLKDCMDLSGKLLDVPHIVTTLLFDSIVTEVIQPFARRAQERCAAERVGIGAESGAQVGSGKGGMPLFGQSGLV